jgi:hypothetical protein
LGANYDHKLFVGATANLQDVVFVPDGGEAVCAPGDNIIVAAPAGGSGITAYVALVIEDLG